MKQLNASEIYLIFKIFNEKYLYFKDLNCLLLTEFGWTCVCVDHTYAYIDGQRKYFLVNKNWLPLLKKGKNPQYVWPTLCMIIRLERLYSISPTAF